MTTKNRWWQILAIMFAISLAASACGSDDGDSSSGTTEAPAAADDDAEDDAMEDDAMEDDAMEDDAMEDAHPPISEDCPIPDPAESVEIDLMGWEFPATAQIADEFEECNDGENLTINVQLLASNDAQDQITTDLGTGSPEFEIVQVTNSTIGTHADNLVDLGVFIDTYSEEFGLDDIPDSLWASGTVDGKILGVPAVSNTMHFFYNKEILADNGVTPPDNFDELITACSALKDAGFDDPFNMNLSANWSWELEFSNVIKSYGGTIVNDDNSPGWNTPEGLQAVEKIIAVNEACMSNAGRAFSIDDAEAALRAGELPMASIWASRAAAMDDPENSLVVGNIEFAAALKSDDSSLRNGPAFVDLYAIPKDTDVDPLIIFQAIMAAVDLESQNATAEHAAVARLSASNSDAPRNAAASTASVAEGVGSRSKNDALPIAQGVLGDALLEITASGADPATALADAEATYIEEAEAAGKL